MPARLPIIGLRWTAAQATQRRGTLRCRLSTQSAGQDDSQAERVDWLKRFEAYLEKNAPALLPKEWISTNFSRSSGPGGQNVNKVNTKAEVRLDLTAASREQRELPSMPGGIVRYLTSKSPYYVASSHSLLISSMKTRTQQGNLQDALEKMQSHVQSVLSQDIRGETSESQKKRVRFLIAKDKIKTRKFKDKRGAVKSGRKAVIVD